MAILQDVLLVSFFAALVSSINAATEKKNARDSGGNQVPAVFVFGDSLVDTGNNNDLPTIAKSNFPPYGRDFPGGRPTGRFSNGRVLSDFVAEMLGVKELLPPYLDPELDLQEMLTGVCFASSGAGYDPRTSKLANAIPITGQFNMLKEYIGKINATVGEATANDITSRSAYMIFLGSNDLTNIYPLVKHLYNEDSYTDLIINLATDFFHNLYAIGARRIGLLTLPPTGCAPALRILDGGGQRVCSESLNRRIKLFNSKLDSAVERMNRELQGAKVVLFDLYNPALSIIENPAAYGIEEVKRGCCGTGNIETAGLCALPGTCDDAGKYLFWDSFHPSEAATRILAYRALSPGLSEFF